jgi:hypothetical protein
MRWLKKFKEILDNNPEITDAELFRAFPELKSDPQRMDAALMYWKYDAIPVEFMPWWRKMIDKLWIK